MNIRELKELLSTFPDDMEILTTCYSDYDSVGADDFTVISAVDKGYYYMRSHPTMSEENKQKEKEYLHISGN